MKQVKKFIVMSVCSLLIMQTVAAEQGPNKAQKSKEIIDFYGKLNISLQATEEKGESFNELKSNASRVGVKGKYYLDNGLTAIYKLEWQVNVNDDTKDTLTARNQWVGIKGGFGELTVGRSDTTLKVSQGKFDLFNDYEGDLKNLFIGENRTADSVTYKSRNFNNIKFLASYIISDDKDLSDPFSIGVHFGDGSLKKTDFFVSLSHDQNMQGKSAIYETTRLVGMYKFGDLRLGAILTESEISDVFEKSALDFIGQSENGYAVNASYKLGDALAKVQYQEFAGADAINFGVDYKLGKSTKVFAWYTDREGLSFDGETIKKATEGTYFAIGMEQKF
jgi:predicted porin